MTITFIAMPYVMEHPDETIRLENQALQKGYRLQEELQHFTPQTGQSVLDAGCGSGLLSRYLNQNWPGLNIHACDSSQVRLQQAKSLCSRKDQKEIHFFHADLCQMPEKVGNFDWIICRYVLEHLSVSKKMANLAIQSMYQRLNKGGQIILIDFDGIVSNLYSSLPRLQKQLDQLIRNLDLDTYVGRKLPALLKSAGFKDIHWDLQTLTFKEGEMECERNNMRDRFSFAYPLFCEALGDKAKADQFISDYLAEMGNTSSTLFYNKFIVRGRKS